MKDLSAATKVFKKMDYVMNQANNLTNPADLIDFMITVGDNIYPAIADDPTDAEFDRMLSLF